MARLAMCGWESGNVHELGAFGQASGSESVVTPGRSGRYAWRSNVNVTQNVAGSAQRFIPLGAFPSAVWIRLAIGNVAMASNATLRRSLLDLLDGSTVQLAFTCYSNGNNYLRVVLGGATAEICSGGAIPSSGFVCLEIHVVFHGSAGTIEVWSNGVKIIDFTGNTIASANARMTDIAIGTRRVEWNAQGFGATEQADYDDLAVNDTTGSVNNGRIGQGGIYPVFPEADTADKDFSRSAGSDNYSLVNSVPSDGDTTYVEAGVLGDRDLYSLKPISGEGEVSAVWFTLNGRVVGGAGATIQPTIKSVATTKVASAIILTNTYAAQGALFETDPNGGIPWTATAINSALIGMTVV